MKQLLAYCGARLRVCCSPSLFGMVGFALVLFVGGLAPVGAVEPSEVLENSVLEKRARSISLGLRCLVCQNQSIDDSDAPLAKDLRVLVRERLKAGDSDHEVLDYVVARYGEFVLLRPPFGIHTFLLWFTPFFVLAVAILLARRTTVQRSQRTDGSGAPDFAALTDDEKKRLEVLLKDDKAS